MAIRKKDYESPRKYYYRVLNAKRDGENWVAQIPCDPTIAEVDKGNVSYFLRYNKKEEDEK